MRNDIIIKMAWKIVLIQNSVNVDIEITPSKGMDCRKVLTPVHYFWILSKFG